MSILLFRKLQYTILNEIGLIEAHYIQFFLNIGYKNAKFLTLEKRYVAEVVNYAELLYISKI